MKIGCVTVPGKVGLAPMAGFADSAFRALCREFGAGYTVTEMISAKAMCFGDRKTADLLRLRSTEHPSAVQIFGSEPAIMARGAALALKLSGADIVDINMGCPAHKVTSCGEGSALLKNPSLACEIVRAVRAAVDCPVTVKLRSGWDAASVVAPELAPMLRDAGADALCIHGRTQADLYTGKADREIQRRVAVAAGIPVIANGDVSSPADAVSLLEYTGADYVFIGRGALGSPWLFSRCRAVLAGLPDPGEPPLTERLNIALRHAKLAAEDKGEARAMREFRAHASHYLHGLRGAASFRSEASYISTLDDLSSLLERVLESQS